jgi:hypothetical protein
MNYVEYNEKIVKQAQRKLVGWPGGVPFRKPGSIGAVTDLRDLWNAIEKKELYFRELTTEEKAALQPRSTDPGTIDPSLIITGKKRKERSDKGKQRGPRKGGDVPDGVENDGHEESQSGSRSKKRKQMGASSSSVPRKKRAKTTV